MVGSERAPRVFATNGNEIQQQEPPLDWFAEIAFHVRARGKFRTIVTRESAARAAQQAARDLGRSSRRSVIVFASQRKTSQLREHRE